MNKLLLSIIAISIILLACGKDNPPSNTNNSNQKQNNLPPSGVYVAGDSFDLSTSYIPYPVYWVNGKEVHLPNSSRSSGSGIAVSDSNVYVSCDGIYSGNKITYWKDTTGINLADPSLPNPITKGITLSGGDLYIVGDGYINGNEKFVPVYWKNNNLAVKMPTFSYSRGEGHAIAVSGNDIYISGTAYDVATGYGSSAACYWKNGTPVFLHPNKRPATEQGIAKSICISGSDVYVVGNIYPLGFASSSLSWAVFWKNGIATDLTPSNVNSQANSVVVVGNDVYIAGAIEGADGVFHATYWKNRMPNTLDPKYSVATAIAVSQNDVYVAENRSVDSALYWKNGIPVILGRGRAYAIAIKK